MRKPREYIYVIFIIIKYNCLIQQEILFHNLEKKDQERGCSNIPIVSPSHSLDKYLFQIAKITEYKFLILTASIYSSLEKKEILKISLIFQQGFMFQVCQTKCLSVIGIIIGFKSFLLKENFYNLLE